MLALRHHHASSLPSIFCLKPSSEPPDNPSSSSNLRRPISHKPPKTPTSNNSKLPSNPLKNLLITQKNPTSTTTTAPSPPLHTLTSKLRLSSKLSPPSPPPPPPSILEETPPKGNEVLQDDESSSEEIESAKPMNEFVQKGKIFVGNLPLWIKKSEVAEFFRQFGPIENVILIKGYNETERNMGFGFVIYGGPTAEKAATKAVEFDGVEFHGRCLTVKLDDGRRLKQKTEERIWWVEGKEEGKLHKSEWHKEREGSRMELRKVIESQPENWQAVVIAFERIKKVRRFLRCLGLLHCTCSDV